MPESFTQIEIIRPGDLSSRAFDFFNNVEFPGQISMAATRIGHPDTGDWRLTWLLSDPIDRPDIIATLTLQAEINEVSDIGSLHAADIALNPIAATNWLEESYRGFPPFAIGRFFLYGQHHRDIDIPAGHTPIMIDAVTAFGSGEHPTTKGCLLLLDRLARSQYRPTRILDHGTGSGILAIAAAKLWGLPVIAADIDPESVRVAGEYRNHNQIAPFMITVYEGATPAQDDIAQHGPYDLIIANILAGPLRQLAPDMAAVATPDARLILSGLLESQVDEVIAAYTPHGFKLADHKLITDWAALLLVRK